MNYLIEEIKANKEDVYKTVIDTSSLKVELFGSSDFPSLNAIAEGSSAGNVAESQGN